jgi:hypothetical protein
MICTVRTLYACTFVFSAVLPFSARADNVRAAAGIENARALLSEFSARQTNQRAVQVRQKTVRGKNVVRAKNVVRTRTVGTKKAGPIVIKDTRSVGVKAVPVGIISTGSIPAAAVAVPAMTIVTAPYQTSLMEKPGVYYNKGMTSPAVQQSTQQPPNTGQQNPQSNPQQKKPNDPMIFVGTSVVPWSAIAPAPENSDHPGWFWFPNPDDKKWYPVRTAKAAAAAGERCQSFNNAVMEWSNRASANGKAYGLDSQEYKDTMAMQKQAIASFLECIQAFPPGEGE